MNGGAIARGHPLGSSGARLVGTLAHELAQAGRRLSVWQRCVSESARASRSSWKAVTLPLAGIKIVEFGNLVAAPYCGMLLADLGAEVVKVEAIVG